VHVLPGGEERKEESGRERGKTKEDMREERREERVLLPPALRVYKSGLAAPVWLIMCCSVRTHRAGSLTAEACSVGKRPARLACILASTQQARLRNGVLKQSCITYHLNAKT